MSDSLRRYVGELFGTFTLVFVGTTAILAAGGAGDPAGRVAIGLAFGLALLAGLYAFGEVSGGHFNPIVSLAMMLDRRLSARDLLPYWAVQLVGAVLASLVVWAAFTRNAVAQTATVPNGFTGAGTALLLEGVASAIFVAVILQATKSERLSGTALVAIALTLATVHLALIPFSGSSVNPARSFGPALVGSEWTDFWVYLVGPPLGAIVGWLVYSVVHGGRAKAVAASS